MRDLTTTLHPNDTRAHVRELWKTDAFLRSHDDPNGYVRRLIDQFAALPRLWCELDEPKIERSHFLAWMGVIAHRHEYDNPAISDLYYFHEYLHAASLTYAADTDKARWAEKIWLNERDASLGSEVFVYFELPGFRSSTFDFEIWADRYLGDPVVVAQHNTAPAEFQAEMERERERAMLHPTPGDRNESMIASYNRLNHDWAEVWDANYLDVESTMAAFSDRVQTDPAGASASLRAWLQDRQGDSLCPFEDEARRFAAAIERERDA